MKKLFLLFALCSAAALFAQNKVGEHVTQLVTQNTTFQKFTPLTADETIAKANSVVKDAQYAKMESDVLNGIRTANNEFIELAIPYNGRAINVQLYRVNIYAEGFHADTDKRVNAIIEKGVHYRGIVKGDPKSVAAFSFFKDGFSGIVSDAEVNNLVVAKLKTPGNTTDYIIYSDDNLLVTPSLKCSTEDPTHVPAPSTQRDGQDIMSTRCVTMYFEIDHDLYLDNNSSVADTNNWMAAAFNQVQTLFANDGITVALKSTFVWTTQDPYFGETSADYLMQFNQMRPVFDGDLGQLVGIDAGGLGGVAVNIAGSCTDYNFSYSDVDPWFSAVPAFSWTIQVITHELGHLMGSPHTHGCYWNNNNTAIDGCGSSAGYVEGNCAQGPIPFVQKGTIMSYCHLVDGVGIKFANGFGLQPRNRILNHVNSSTCLSTDCINTCIDGIAGISVVSGANTAQIMWDDVSSFGPWTVSYTTLNGTFTNWQTVTTNVFNITGLDPNTYYKFAVRPVCGTGLTAETHQYIFATNTANICAGMVFTDTGGISGNYGNNQYLVRTFTPNSPGSKIKVAFTSLSLEPDYDYMYVINGMSVNAPLLATLNGSANPGTFQSTADDGSLTFVFISDQEVAQAGWNANVTCSTLSTQENTFVDFRYYPNPTNGLVTISAQDVMEHVEVYNVAGQKLFEKQINTTDAQVDISAFAEGVYFFKVSNGSKEANFRIIKQ